jgi:tRNA A37 threonylcarbamoyladenosine dehydratase
MIIGENTLPDPADFTIDDITGTSEETLLSGDRRYLKFGKIKKNIRLLFRGIDDSDKGTIETVALSTGTLSMTLDGKSYTVVSYSGPKFTRMKGQDQLYQCDWELREV